MKKIKLLTYFILLTCILSSCGAGDVGKILRNEKVTSTDEFLVKKREPLTEPPDVKKLPTPNSSSNSGDNKQKKSSIKELLKTKEQQNNTSSSKTSSAEDLIISQIKK